MLSDRSYAYLTNVAGVPYGPAFPGGQSTDNSQPFTESGMFVLSSAGSNQLNPAWVNTDGSVVTGQTFARDGAGNVLITGTSEHATLCVGGQSLMLASERRQHQLSVERRCHCLRECLQRSTRASCSSDQTINVIDP